MATWTSLKAAHRYHKAEGFITGRFHCPACGLTQDTAVEPNPDMSRPDFSKFPCERCGLTGLIFTEWKENQNPPCD